MAGTSGSCRYKGEEWHVIIDDNTVSVYPMGKNEEMDRKRLINIPFDKFPWPKTMVLKDILEAALKHKVHGGAHKVFTLNKKVKSLPFEFEVTDSTYTDKGRLGGNLVVGGNKYPGFFEYTESTGIGWKFKGKGQTILSKISEAYLSGELQPKEGDAFESWQSAIIGHIAKQL